MCEIYHCLHSEGKFWCQPEYTTIILPVKCEDTDMFNLVSSLYKMDFSKTSYEIVEYTGPRIWNGEITERVFNKEKENLLDENKIEHNVNEMYIVKITCLDDGMKKFIKDNGTETTIEEFLSGQKVEGTHVIQFA